MANEDILAGLRSALTRGYSLEEAMLSFYNAGYKRENIEDAARQLQMQAPVQSVVATQPQAILPKPKSMQNPKQFPQKQEEVPAVYQPKFEGNEELSKGIWTANQISAKPKETPEAKVAAKPVVQKSKPQVSAYSSYESKLKMITIVLIVLLLVLIGVLGIIFLFKQPIIQFFNNLF